LVLEAERFPRFHIGESLLPLGDKVFQELGVADKLRGVGFVVKHGAQLKTGDGAHTVLFDFRQAQHVDPPWAFQVHRAEFDQMLLEHARGLGAEVVHGRARDCRFGADGVEVDHDGGGVVTTVRAKAIVDATGRSGFVAKKVGVRVVDRELRKAAVYAHFADVPADPGVRAGDTRIVSLPKLGWAWFIPLKDGVTSVGCVLDITDYEGRAKGDPAAIFEESIASAPQAAAWLAPARRVSEYHVESGFSYSSTAYCGDRWFLAGDAGSFLDPIFSTGVLMALRSGLEAADAVHAGYTGPRCDPRAARARFDRTLRERYAFVRKFVLGFYDAATRDMFFAPRPMLGLTRAVTTVLAGGFDLSLLDRLRVKLFFLLGRLQRRYDLVPRLSVPPAAASVDEVGP
ncbi:MAG: tryptophan 7-halogenase, partial [Planctomycetes bacterium]|nr:tryptophan 7-halogenase [Planctomycetota bacterium]